MDPEVRLAEVRDGVVLAFWRAGPQDGTPLLLVHGWPETKRIWERNVGPLAEAGFDVLVPDLRGFGDSGIPADGFFDLAAHARDLHALCTEVCRWSWCFAAGGDLGGGVVIDLGMRFPGFVRAQVLFNCVLPVVGAAAEPPDAATRMAADYFARQARDADGLAASLRSDEERIAYVETFYGSRFWATPGAFDRAARRRHAEPFGDAARFRASLANYESAVGTIPCSEKPMWFAPSDVPALALYGPDDHVMQRDWPARARDALADVVGPFVVPGAGHFLQWEQAGVLNGALSAFLRGIVP